MIEQGIYGYTVAGGYAQALVGRAIFTWDTPPSGAGVTKYKIKLWKGNPSGNLIVWTQYRAWKDVAIFTYDPANDYAHGEWDYNCCLTNHPNNSDVMLLDYGATSALRIGNLWVLPNRKYRLELRAVAGTTESDSVTADVQLKHRPGVYRTTQYARFALENHTREDTGPESWIDREARYPLYGEQYVTGPTEVVVVLNTYDDNASNRPVHFEKADFSIQGNDSIGTVFDYTRDAKHIHFRDQALTMTQWNAGHKRVLFTPDSNASAGDTLVLGVKADSWGVRAPADGITSDLSFEAKQDADPDADPHEVPAWEATFSGSSNPRVLWVSFANYQHYWIANSAYSRESPMHGTGPWRANNNIDVFVAFTSNTYITWDSAEPYIELKITEGEKSETVQAKYYGVYDDEWPTMPGKSEIFRFRYEITNAVADNVGNGWVTIASDAIQLPTDSHICLPPRPSFPWLPPPSNCDSGTSDDADVTLPVRITSVTQSSVSKGFRYTVTYQQPVKVIGTPYLTATGTSKDGQTTKVVKAKYKSGSESKNLVFEYLLQDDDGLGPEPTFSWGWLPASSKYDVLSQLDANLSNRVSEFMMRFDKWIEEVDDGQGNKTKVERNSYILAKRSGQTAYDWDADRRMPANVPSETWTVNRTATASVDEQTGNQTQELEEPVEVVLRSLIAPTRIALTTALGGGAIEPRRRRWQHGRRDTETEGSALPNPQPVRLRRQGRSQPQLRRADLHLRRAPRIGRGHLADRLQQCQRRLHRHRNRLARGVAAALPPLARQPRARLRRGRATLFRRDH